MVKNIRKALAPQGIFGTFGKIPYVKTDALSLQIVSSIKLGQLLNLIKVVESGPKSADISKDIKNIANGKNGSENREPEGSAPEKETSGTTDAGSSAKPTTSSKPASGDQPAPAEKSGTKLTDTEVVNLAKSIGVGNNDDIVSALKALNDLGHLKA